LERRGSGVTRKEKGREEIREGAEGTGKEK